MEELKKNISSVNKQKHDHTDLQIKEVKGAKETNWGPEQQYSRTDK